MNRILVFGTVASVLGFWVLVKAPAQVGNGTLSLSDNRPPAPIWSGAGNLPAGSGDRKVFLTPDLHSVILLWQDPDGAERRQRFPLHNEIDPNLRVRMESDSGLFRYRYDLENGKDSKDSLTDFSVVIYPGPDVETSSVEWSRGDIASGARERIGIPGASSGVLVHWTYTLQNPFLLKPGMNTNFTVTTSARPGFTSAATEHFPHMEPSDRWPEDLPQETLDQLMPVVIGDWVRGYLITFGPRYGPDDPAEGIAADYLVGIQELIRIHRLAQGSLFVKEAIADLDAIASGSSAHFTITQKPASEIEAEILNGLELSLRLAYSAPK